jgi:hypothetical protein
MTTTSPAPTGPGFITLILDVPFAIALPNGAYRVFDSIKTHAVVQTTLREGSRTFFRNEPIIGPTSFTDLNDRAREYQRPQADYSYLLTSRLSNGTEKATLNIYTGRNGGFAETKCYSEIQVTFLEDDLSVVGKKDNYVLGRAADIVNAFLDKYRLLTEDYRISRIAADRHFYFASCHSSPLAPAELGMTSAELVDGLAKGRAFIHQLGHGGANILRTNSLDHLGPRSEVSGTELQGLITFIQTAYEMPLSYDLVMQALRSLQIERDAKLAIVHAATAVEVHVMHLLHNLLVSLGQTASEAWNVLETQPDYEGVSKRLTKLDSHSKIYCDTNGLPWSQFKGGNLFNRWQNTLALKRNRAVHAGVSSFTWREGVEAIGVAKETIRFLDQRVSSLSNKVQLTASVANLNEAAGGVLF